MRHRNSNGSVMRGMIAGALGGLVASWVMNGFIAGATTLQESMKSTEQKAQEQEQKAAQHPEEQQQHDQQDGRQNDQQQPNEDSTMKVADAFAWLVTGQHLSREGKQKGGPIVHYAFGTINGALYGALAELSPAVTSGVGTAFGTGLYIAADEVMVPALVTGQFPTKEGASSQLTHYGAHLVYGAATELVRRAVA